MSEIVNFLERSKETIQNAKENLHKRIFDAVVDYVSGEFTDSVSDYMSENKVVHQALNDSQKPLTDYVSENQLDEIKDIFGDSIHYDEVIINDSSATAELNAHLPGNSSSRPFVLGNTINSADPISGEKLIHEMMHIYQYQTGGWNYIPEALGSEYDYTHQNLVNHSADTNLHGNRLAQFNPEQQAEIVKDYYNLTQLSGNDTIILETGEMVDSNNIDKYLIIYKPYIDEIQQNRSIEPGVYHEINEMVEQTLNEVGEGGEEITKQVINGNYMGAGVETVEATLEVSRENVEGVFEVGRETANNAVDAVKEEVNDTADIIKDEFNDRIFDAFTGGISK